MLTKKFIYSLFLTCLLFSVQGNTILDSLRTELHKEKKDTAQIRILQELAFASFGESPQDAFSYLYTAQQKATSIQNNDLLSSCYYNLGKLYHKIAEYDSAKIYYNE